MLQVWSYKQKQKQKHTSKPKPTNQTKTLSKSQRQEHIPLLVQRKKSLSPVFAPLSPWRLDGKDTFDLAFSLKGPG